MAMDEDESLRRYGLHPAGASLDEVRDLLTVHVRLEREAQGRGASSQRALPLTRISTCIAPGCPP